ncbi:MAG: proline dehydrogenase family protein [Saprospiraceae bacterium]
MIELPKTSIDFNNTEIAFEAKSNKALKKASWLFSMMNNPTLVNVGSKLGLLALKMRLPVEGMIKKTIFEQFCGGTTLLNSQPTIDELSAFGVQSILDYGAEGKESDEDFNRTMREIMEAIKFAGQNTHVPFISVKITGLGRFALLEKFQSKDTFTAEEQDEFNRVMKRLDSICHLGKEHNTGVFVDAEESWIQDTIDYMVNIMMSRYNKTAPTVYNTYQFYRHDRLAYLKQSFKLAQKQGFILGGKLVRGAYMDKERARATEKGYPSPIQPNKAKADEDYDLAVRFCVKNYKQIASCTATHNAESSRKQVELIERLKLPKNHKHFLFSQLYGMSDHLTFNLQKAGFNTAKYIPYGPVKDVVPYLIRRAKENTSVTGDMGRELLLINKEIKRRNI